MRHIAYIGIGSNVGDKVARCEEAIKAILSVAQHKLLARSSLFNTQPVGYLAQDWFVNGVIKIETPLNAPDLLQSLKAIESLMGRSDTFRWGPRIIDLDVLLFDESEIQTPQLQIPHPRLQERQFVLIPLAEIEPTLVHPVLKKTIQELLAELKEDQGVERLRTC